MVLITDLSDAPSELRPQPPKEEKKGPSEALMQAVEKNIQALPGRIIVRFPPPKTHTDEGFEIPEMYRQLERKARVVAIGAPLTEEDDIFCQMVGAGDFVFAHPEYGQRFSLEDSEGNKHEFVVFRNYEIFFRFPQ